LPTGSQSRLSWDDFIKLLGVLGFVISVTNLVSTTRNRTVKPQAELLSELRGRTAGAIRSPTTASQRQGVHENRNEQAVIHINPGSPAAPLFTAP
jgi:hypothetical protein